MLSHTNLQLWRGMKYSAGDEHLHYRIQSGVQGFEAEASIHQNWRLRIVDPLPQ